MDAELTTRRRQLDVTLSENQANAILEFAKQRLARAETAQKRGDTGARIKAEIERWQDLVKSLEDGLAPNPFDSIVV